MIQLKKPLSQISNALERSRRTIAVVSCWSTLAHEILRWIAAREVEWFSKNQIDNSRVRHINFLKKLYWPIVHNSHKTFKNLIVEKMACNSQKTRILSFVNRLLGSTRRSKLVHLFAFDAFYQVQEAWNCLKYSFMNLL